MSDRRLSPAGFEPAPKGQQAGSRWRVKPFASRRLRRSLTGQGLTRLAGLLWPGRTQPRQKETEMGLTSDVAPTSRQLRYLRVLAGGTATTFAYPQTRSDASREIDRLRQLADSPQTSRLEDPETHSEQLHYATAVQA